MDGPSERSDVHGIVGGASDAQIQNNLARLSRRRTSRLMRTAALTLITTIALGVTAPGAGIADVPPASLPPVRVKVTGDPAPVETLRLAILTSAKAVVPGIRAGEMALTETAPPLQPLPLASAMALRAIVQVAPFGLQPVIHSIPVEITNANLPWSDARDLLVSNSPETLPFGKVLLSRPVAAGETVRLLYHHQNGSPDRHMVLEVNLSNPARTPITLWIAGAAGAEGTDEFGQGHTAARAFLEQYWHRAGFMARIPANTTLPLFLHDLAPQAVASGLVQLALIDGARLNVDVFARLEGEMDPPLLSFAPNFDKVHPRGTFEHPRVMQALTYTVGDPPLAMTVGDDRDALHEAQTGAPLKGNYGVIYAFPIDLTNPRPLPAILGLIFQASGGDGGGTVLVDDQVFDLAWVKSGERRMVTTLRLAPGEHRTVLVSTMPESGANYPVRLSLGSEYK